MSPRLARGLLAGLLICTGCATAPVPVDTANTTVVLLPDDEGKVGAIVISTPQGSERVDQAYLATVVSGTHPTPADGPLGQQAFDTRYQAIIAAQPTHPRTFILYFVLGTTELTAESRAMLPEVLRTAHERKPTEITVFGYADATGTEIRNEHISAARARSIAAALQKSDSGLGPISVQFFGSKEPLVPTSQNVAEPRNRRAEVVIL